MRKPQWSFASGGRLLLLLLLAPFPASAQVLAVNKADVGPSPSVTLDVTVLGLPSSGLKDVGLFFPEPEPGVSSNAAGFAIVLPEEEANALSGNPRAILLHRLKQPATVNPTKLRIEARTPLAPGADENQPYYEVGIALDVTSGIVSRSVGLSTSSVVQIRRGPGPAGLAPLVLETTPIKHDVQVQEGKTILLGGFFSSAEATRLPDLPPMPESPLLNYVLSKAPRGPDDSEIVVLLTPRRIGGIPEPVAVAVNSSPAVNIAPPPVPPLVVPTPVIASLPEPVAPKPVLASVTTPVTLVASPSPDRESGTTPFYSVQTGAFRSRANADALLVKLEKQFEDVFVKEVAAGNTPYRVRVGHLPNAKQAKRLQTKLAAQGFDSFIVTPEAR